MGDNGHIYLHSYIFHEVRGPLNNVNLGIELLSGHPAITEDDELLEIVRAIFSPVCIDTQ